MKKFTLLNILMLLLLGGFTAQAQFSESFDSTATPTDWTVINMGDDNTWLFGSPPSGSPYSGSGNAYITYSSNAHDDYLVTPQISVASGTTDQLRFYARNNSSTFVEKFDLLVSTTGTEATDFTDTLESHIGPPTTWTEYVYDLSAYTGQDIYISFHATSTDELRLHIDDVINEGIPSCPKPTDPSASITSMTGADLMWTENGDAAEWNVIYGEAGFDPETEGTTVVDDDGTPGTSLSSLLPETNYDFYIRAICGVDDESELSDMGTFYTGFCVSIPTSNDNDGILNVQVGTTDFAGTDTTYLNFTGSPVDVPQSEMANLQVTFGTGYTYGTNVWVDFNDNLEFESSELVFQGTSESSNPTTLNASFIIPLDAPMGNHRLRIGTADSGQSTPKPCYNGSFGVTVDLDLNVTEAPSCLAPTDLMIDALSFTEATVSWTENGIATQWEVIYGEAGFDPETEGTTVVDNDGTPGTVLPGLTPNSSYDFYVRAICSVDDESSLSVPASFYTGYCTSIPTSNDNDGILNVQVGTTDFAGTDTTYLNFTGSPVDVARSEMANVQVTFGTGYTYGTNIWVDFNDNLEFESSELVFQGTSLSDDPTTLNASFMVPLDAPLGNHRLRIGTADSGQSTPNPCYNGSFGVTVDLDINVTEAPACLAPTDLMVDALTTTEATVSWTESGSATQWEVIYGEAGFDPETEGTTVLDDDGTPGTILPDLTPETNYDFYVRAICGVDDESNLSVVASFFTGYCQYTGADTNHYLNNFSTAGGVLNISNLETGDAPTGYADYTDQVVSQFATGIIDFSASFGTGTYGLSIYIDWNNNMAFEDSEKVFTTDAYVSDASGIIEVPDGTPNGDYRMRVVADWLSTDPDACGDHDDGEAEDYTFTVIDQPSCLPPTYLVIEDLTSETADINWTENGSATSWEITYGESGFDPETEGTTVTDGDGTPGITLIDLLPGTDYDFYVSATCSVDDQSTLSGPASFLTECASVTEFFEDFDNTSTDDFPVCWGKIGTNGSASLQDYSANSDPNTLYMYAGNANSRPVIKTIPVSNLGDGTHQLSFNMRANFTVGGVVEIGYLTNPTVDSSFVPLDSVVAASIAYAPYTVIPEAGTYSDFLALRTTGVPANSLLIDDVAWEVIPTCPKPTDLVVESVSLNSADVNWTENGSAVEWEVVYGEAGFDPETEGTTLTDNDGTPGMTIPGLDENTEYEFYVRAICGTDDESLLVGPQGFGTLCSATDVTYTMDFESATVPELPLCTARSNESLGNDWETESLDDYGFNSIVLSYSYDLDFPANAWFYTQGINMTAGTQYQISYKYGNNSTFYAEKLKVSYGTAVGASAMVNELADYPDISMEGSTSDTIYFTVDADDVYYFGFNAYSIENQYYLYLDDIVIEVVAAGCDSPMDVAVSNIDMTSATVTWTETSTATDGYTVEVFATGANPETDTPVFTENIAAGTATSDVTGLEAETTYDAYVTSNCGSEDAMSDAVTFTTSPNGVGELDAYGLTYYPNPVKNILNMSADTPIQDITVYNLLGKKVIEVNPESTTVSMDMSNLASGSYLVKVTINNSVATYKLMKD